MGAAYPLKFVRDVGGYRVYDDHGRFLGTVRRWERRYNLNRVSVSRGWRAVSPQGDRLYGENSYTAETRRDAAFALANCAATDPGGVREDSP